MRWDPGAEPRPGGKGGIRCDPGVKPLVVEEDLDLQPDLQREYPVSSME